VRPRFHRVGGARPFGRFAEKWRHSHGHGPLQNGLAVLLAIGTAVPLAAQAQSYSTDPNQAQEQYQQRQEQYQQQQQDQQDRYQDAQSRYQDQQGAYADQRAAIAGAGAL